MEERELICIVCPRGCRLHVDKDLNVTGNFCPRGEIYGKQEVTNPTRMVTSTIRISNAELPLCPVRTKDPIPKSKIFDVMASINNTKITAPVHIGDVIIHDVCGTGVDIIAIRNMEKM